MKKTLVGAIVMTLALTGCAQSGQNQMGGTLIGGAAGGLLGSQFGGGKGRLVAVGLGTLAGAVAGNAVGQSMDQQNQAKLAK